MLRLSASVGPRRTRRYFSSFCGIVLGQFLDQGGRSDGDPSVDGPAAADPVLVLSVRNWLACSPTRPIPAPMPRISGWAVMSSMLDRLE
jgi:hypothetical protein